MSGSGFRPAGRRRSSQSVVICLIVALTILVGCGTRGDGLQAADYAPQPGGDWPLSTPAEQGLDPNLVADLYANAADVETLKALLVIKNGHLIAEGYFGSGAIDSKERVQSVTKSYTSALMGLALEKGCLASLDQKMIDFFPELADQITDPRKKQITVRQMLQMRAGYPWEESDGTLFEMLYGGFRPSYLVPVPLVSDPGTQFEYSNLTSHLVGVVVARACGTDLRTFAEDSLFSPLGVELGEWTTDWEGNYNGHGDLHFTARDMAKFGLLYLNQGEVAGKRIIPAQWVRDSLQTYSEKAWTYRVGRNFSDIGYGYQWWSARAGDHGFNLAWGHGGQQIVLLPQHNMVIVVKAEPFYGQHGDKPWKHEKANLNLVGDFIASLP